MFCLWVNCELPGDCGEQIVCSEMFWHFLFHCPYALCSYVYLAALLSCSTGSKGHVNHVINSVLAFRHSTMHLSPLNLGAVYNVEEIGVSWCQILMRRDMEIAETLCVEQRAGNTLRHCVENRGQEIHISPPQKRRWNPGEWKLQEQQRRKLLNLMSEHQEGLNSKHKPMRNAKPKSFVKVYLEKPQCWGVTVT